MNVFVVIGTFLMLTASILGVTGHASKHASAKKPAPVVRVQLPVQKDETESHTLAGSHAVTYQNTQYGFEFTLPDSWSGYTIVNDRWVGNAVGDSGEIPVESGPLLSIRHPRWTAQNPRQDIPIMIFTLAQWNALQQEKFHIGAAPIGPSELGRTSSHVFALPARYNFAFPTGYEDVETILNNKPLTPLR